MKPLQGALALFAISVLSWGCASAPPYQVAASQVPAPGAPVAYQAAPSPTPGYEAQVASARADLAAANTALGERRAKRSAAASTKTQGEKLAALDAEIAELEARIAILESEIKRLDTLIASSGSGTTAAAAGPRTPSYDSSSGQTVYTGPRGGRYVITESGNKRYIGKGKGK